MTEREQIIKDCNTSIDTYHGLSHPAELGHLWQLRRDLVANLARLVRTVKQAHGEKGMSYVFRKYIVASEMVTAMNQDKANAGVKPRSMAQLEAQTAALKQVLDAQNEAARREAEWEEVTETIKMIDKVLFAMSQEISDGMKERDYSNHLEALRIKDEYNNKTHKQQENE